MADREVLLALAERCEKASGPDKLLGREVLLACGFGYVSPLQRWMDPTAFFDAAMTLVPTDWNITLRGVNESWHVALNATAFGPLRQSFGFAQSASLALCAAALRARAMLSAAPVVGEGR